MDGRRVGAGARGRGCGCDLSPIAGEDGEREGFGVGGTQRDTSSQHTNTYTHRHCDRQLPVRPGAGWMQQQSLDLRRARPRHPEESSVNSRNLRITIFRISKIRVWINVGLRAGDRGECRPGQREHPE